MLSGGITGALRGGLGGSEPVRSGAFLGDTAVAMG